MSSAEYADWVEYAQVEPWGEQRADIRAAIVACTVARSQGAKVELEDFLPQYGAESAVPISCADIRRRFAGLAR